MKLKTKLLPLVGVAAAAATMPLALTSCNKDNKNVIDFFDENYEGMVPFDGEGKTYSPSDIAPKYFGAKNKNAIIADDIRYFLSTASGVAAIVAYFAEILIGEDYHMTLNTATGTIENIKVGYIRGNKGRISGNISLNCTATFFKDEEKTQKYADYSFTCSYAIRRMEYNIYWQQQKTETGETYECFSCNPTNTKDALAGNKEWSIVCTYTGAMKYADDGKTETESKSMPWKYDRLPGEADKDIQAHLKYIGWDFSHYLSATQGKEA